MANSLVCSGSVNPAGSTANTTQYWNVYGYTDRGTNPDFRYGSIYDDGVLSKLKIKISTNSVSDTTVFTIMKNTVAGNQSISVPTTQTGFFEDVTNTDTIANGDDICLRGVPGAGSTGTYFISYIAMIFTSDTAGRTISHFMTSHATGKSIATASTTHYWSLNSYLDTSQTTETNVQYKIKQAGTMLGFHAWIATNARTTTTTLRIRKNASDQSPVISVGNQATGWFGDENTSFSVAVDDLLNFSSTTGTGTQSIAIAKMTCALVLSDSSKLSTYTGHNILSIAQGRNIVRYYAFCGYFDSMTTEAPTQFELPEGSSFTAKNLNIGIKTNTVSSNSTFVLRKNGNTTSLSVSVTASTTGWFQDTTHTEALVTDDLLDYMFTTGTGSGSQSLNVIGYGIVFEDTYTPPSVEATPNGKDIINNKVLIKV